MFYFEKKVCVCDGGVWFGTVYGCFLSWEVCLEVWNVSLVFPVNQIDKSLENKKNKNETATTMTKETKQN